MTEPRTKAGLNLWEWFESDALPIDEFGFKDGKQAIVAIEQQALEDASFLPIAEIERLRSIERAARAAVEADEDYMRRVNDPEGYLSVSTRVGWQHHEQAVDRARTTMSRLRVAVLGRSV
jgi:hypothetical protein